ncbi:pyocin knob domain-containing protein [Paenibacillus ehimensis]|uniref:pyocin knob domain-containing protein n=1 Tax=Paenibacillus ehimensis TaxID=79264 RepID=UPI00046F30F0|nr:pyocin knob domain-containing protein [Paenibacillus ehimensis]
MAYTPTIWVDRLVQYPGRYRVTENGDGTITLTPEPGTVTATGTPVSAANMNHIEQGIAAALPKDGSQPFTGQELRMLAINAGIELGSVTTQNTPYIDFHSIGENTDFDVRIIASGGDPSTAGKGSLRIVSSIFTHNDEKIWTSGNDGAGSGLDADLLDGKHASDFAPSGYGLGGAARGVSGTNFNDHVASGFYYGSNMLNSPNGSADWFFFYAIQHGGIDYCVQVATHYWSNRQWFRRKQTDVWQPWIEIWNHDNLRWNSGGYLEYNNGGAWTPLGGVKEVQRGEAFINESDGNVVVGINPVNLKKSWINFPNTGGTSSSSWGNGWARFLDSTHIQIKASLGGTYQYEVVEYY